jgi:transposase
MKKADFTYDIVKHEKFFFSQLSEQGKRQYAGLQAMKIGYYGVKEVSKRLDIHEHTVRKGKKELLEQVLPPTNKIRQKGGGRKKNVCCKRID